MLSLLYFIELSEVDLTETHIEEMENFSAEKIEASGAVSELQTDPDIDMILPDDIRLRKPAFLSQKM